MLGFNPHPVLRPDATGGQHERIVVQHDPFQSSSGAETGCNDAVLRAWERGRGVSILIRC